MNIALRAFAVFAIATIAEAGILRVDVAGSGDFTDLQAAIDASIAGDILLVKPGSYEAPGVFAIGVVGKGITITADPPLSTFDIVGRFVVMDTPTGQSVIVRGARAVAMSTWFLPIAGFVVTNNLGSVLLEDCIGVGSGGAGLFGSSIPGSPGILVQHSAAVSIVRTMATGGSGVSAFPGGAVGSYPASPGGPGVRVYASKLTLHDCAFTGGHGGNGAGTSPSAVGGFGAIIESALVNASGCSLVAGAQNGSALLILTPFAPVRVLDSTIVPHGTGVAVMDSAGALQEIPGTARHFAVSSPVREQAPAAFSLDGEPGDLAILFLGFGIDAIPLSGATGMLQASLPLQGPFVLGTLPAPDGVLSFNVPAPDLVVPGLLGFTSILQPFLVAGAEAYAAPPSSFVLVDSTL